MTVRIEVAGGFHHVTARRAGGGTLFHDERDAKRFLRYLSRTVERFGWRLHAYCLMTNHYHLLIETPEPNLGRGMLVLNGSYARYLNWRHGLRGHVFQGPYYAEPIMTDEHLQEVCRYIVRNPVRAGLVATPGDWRWSSYRATGALEPPPAFLTVDFIRRLFGSPDAYRDFCNRALDEAGLQSRAV